MFFLKLPRMKNPRNEQSVETILNCPPGMGTSLRRRDFWDRVVAQARPYDWLMVALNTIDQSELTLAHPNGPKNHFTQTLYPSSVNFVK